MIKSEMKIKAIAPWFGGKRNLAPKIIQLLGKHRVYWEPFCGSCAVLLAKEPCMMETVCDLHGDLINLARVLQKEDTAIELYKRVERTLMCEQLHKEAAARGQNDTKAIEVLLINSVSNGNSLFERRKNENNSRR